MITLSQPLDCTQESPIETLGCIGQVVWEADHLRLKGWLVALNAGPVDGFRVKIGGTEITEFSLEKNIPSPDVKQRYPALNQAEKARYVIRVPLSSVPRHLMSDALITLTPLFNGCEGFPVFNLLESSLPLPPEEDRGGVGDSFLFVGCDFLNHLVQRSQLKPTDAILDVGCGVGRMAYPLAYYLAPMGQYDGFDIVQKWINWNQQTFQTRIPRFNFKWVDLYNPAYNPQGTLKTADFVFPYGDESFDIILLASIFTHIRSQEARQYLDQIYRVLKPGGRCLLTCFLLNPESEALIAAGKSSQNLVHELEECFAADPAMPENSIGFKESLLLNWIIERNLQIQGKYYGWWCSRDQAISCQDMLVLKK